MNKKNCDDIKGEFVIDKNAKPWTPEAAARAVFGMPLDDLIKDIRENRDGKYDSLYIHDNDKK